MKFLLLNNQKCQYWSQILELAVLALGSDLETCGDPGHDLIPWDDYDLIIVDASAVSDLMSTITLIREQEKNARIVVFSPAPNWKQARDVMLAGVIDYELKSSDSERLLSVLEKNLAKAAPRWLE